MQTCPLVDTHCHVDLYKNPAEILTESEANQIYTIAVTNAPFVFRNTAKMVSGTRYTRAAAGLHPELVETHGNQLQQLQSLINETRYVGEIGLDYSSAVPHVRKQQRLVFSQILSWCADSSESKILTVHSRRAAEDVISAIGNDFPGKIILHWFTGTQSEIDRAIARGLYFSVNTAMLTPRCLSLISQVPKNRILTESDGPFAKVKGKFLRPVNVIQALDRLAKMWRVSSANARIQVFDNFRSLFSE